jgi:flavin reductase (DIM6/NTAB) family NADH-FMN oxidoreductase RutF
LRLPARITIAVTKKPDAGYNLITLEWFMRTSIQPPMFAISIGHPRYSHDCLEAHRYFNLVFPSVEQESLCRLAGSTSGRDSDKFEVGKVDFFPGKLQKLPVPKASLAVLECEVVTQVRSGDHTIYVGQVHYSWIDADQALYYEPR